MMYRMTPQGLARHVMTIENEATGVVEVILELIE
tara:strand:- start:1870 stop:1971 length:102 start_codon:yes stop_codon:yes gene_type:complete